VPPHSRYDPPSAPTTPTHPLGHCSDLIDPVISAEVFCGVVPLSAHQVTSASIPADLASELEYSTQSYTGYEPTSMRAIRARYNPYVQVGTTAAASQTLPATALLPPTPVVSVQCCYCSLCRLPAIPTDKQTVPQYRRMPPHQPPKVPARLIQARVQSGSASILSTGPLLLMPCLLVRCQF